MRIAARCIEEMVAHARGERPRECCGLVAADGDAAVRVYRVENAHDHPEYGYVVDGRELIARLEEIEDAGWRLGAIYHSHPRTRAAALADRHQPGLRARRRARLAGHALHHRRLRDRRGRRCGPTASSPTSPKRSR